MTNIFIISTQKSPFQFLHKKSALAFNPFLQLLLSSSFTKNTHKKHTQPHLPNPMKNNTQMANHEQEHQEPRKIVYPLDKNCYKLLDEIGRGVSAIVYKAICIPVNNSVVAIKSIDLDQSRSNLDNVRREAKTMSLLSHPNILNAHCSFTVDHCLWVVMPFMSAGSLQSIIAASFEDGLSEQCIAIVLKETLCAVAYLHDQGHLHRDIKAGNILVDSNGAVKLADFGVSASIYEPNLSHGGSILSSSSWSRMFTDFAGTPYWMAPEVIHSHTGYSFKADIWSTGITALELAHGRPPLSNLPPSKTLLMKITKGFRFSDYEKANDNKNKKFSKAFKDMVGLCLDQDPSKRPSAEKLLKHSFFKYCKGTDFLVKNLLQGLPSVEQRFREAKIKRNLSMEKEDEDDDFSGETVKHRRISGWNFNLEGFELDPVFPTENIIQEKGGDQSDDASSEAQVCVQQCHDEAVHDNVCNVDVESLASVVESNNYGFGIINKESMLGNLLFLKKSLEDQRQKVINVIELIGGGDNLEMSKEEQLMDMIEKLRIELENEKRKNYALEMKLEFIKLQSSYE